MQTTTELYAPLIGRILIGGFFVWSAIEAALNLSSLVEYVAHSGIPYATGVAAAAVLVEAVGGIAIVTDLKTRVAALMLILFVLLSSVVFFSASNSASVQLFLQQMSLVGGLLYVLAYAQSGPLRGR